MRKIYKISPKNFLTLGRIIAYPKGKAKKQKKNLFHKVIIEKSKVGWRIAYLVVRDKAIKKLERHVGTFESFEPVSGRTLLYAATRRNPAAIRCFYLDMPVVLKKGIWHGVVTMGKESEIKITENARVKSEYWRLGIRL